MAESQTEAEAAKRIAAKMESEDKGTVTHKKSRDGGRHVFNYTGPVHAHHVPDGWEINGFGSGWFALKRDD
jgi:hypothetical protein